MEGVLSFVETLSAYVFRPGVLTPTLHALWELLVDIVRHYSRSDTSKLGHTKGTRSAADEGWTMLLQYAQTMELMQFEDKNLTYNLHLAACRYVTQYSECY